MMQDQKNLWYIKNLIYPEQFVDLIWYTRKITEMIWLFDRNYLYWIFQFLQWKFAFNIQSNIFWQTTQT